ncbi:hypothetical protein [Novosphingopyxis sp. YJ-S2-01]|uniref:hypothetical protein n=1 Tax=Novosphingopyxis sp. YJ-S2-01 TaxID=2794021 RepID=UPI0018DB7C6D|nr:hypothetical protein [Novosphingopyxis sp. YJ-S2-01]MBH9538351.1 hypothetical protein [Novosphingopyxis sp. YJ-S2-01]
MKRLCCLLPLLLLPGCVQGSESFPSLLPRPYEVDAADLGKRPASEPAPTPAPVTPLSDKQRRTLDAAVEQARSANAAFRAALPDVRRAVSAAAGSSRSSEPWIYAQVLLSRLEMARAPSVEALATIDQLLIERLAQESQGAAGAGTAEIKAARAPIAEAVEEQSAIITNLAGRIG